MQLLNSYFDFDDYDSPVRTFLDDVNLFSFPIGTAIIAQYYIQNNEVEKNDNIFYNFNSEVQSFYSIEKNRITYNNKIASGSDIVFSMFMNLSQKHNHYQRTVFTFFDMFGIIGGVLEIFTL